MNSWRIPWRATVWRPLLAHPAEAFLAILGVALGVALGLAIALINVQAVQDVSSGLRRLAGQADLVLSRPGTHLGERWYARLAMAPGVAVAAPQLRVNGILPNGRPLPVWGIDALQSAALGQPIVPPDSGHPSSLFNPLHLVLDQSALRLLHLRPGDHLILRAAGVPRRFTIITAIPDPIPGKPLAILDIAAAQWLWGENGKISQVSLRLGKGMTPEHFRSRWLTLLPPGATLRTPRDEGSVSARASLAYRTNLLVLSLVALFTGSFLVYTTLAFTAIRQRRSLAILRVLGLCEREVFVAILVQGLLLGIPGALVGVPLGILAAWLALAKMGANLGAGYFSATGTDLSAHPWLWSIFALAGIGSALLGTVWPAWECRYLPIVRLLGPGSEEEEGHAHVLSGFILLALAGGMAAMPPVRGIAYGAYSAIAVLLLAVLFLLPQGVRLCGRVAPRTELPLPRLVVDQLRGSPGRASRSLATIVVAFSLVVAMAVMVGSFRESVAGWLRDVLRADIYLQAGTGGQRLFPLATETRLCRLPGVRRCSLLRDSVLQLLPHRPPVELLARGMNPQQPGKTLQILRAATPDPTGPPPAWISEILAALGHWKPGQTIDLPIGPKGHLVRIAGIYRDYAYQQGAVTLPFSEYRRWTGHRRANGLALWLRTGVPVPRILEKIRQRFPHSSDWQIATPGEIRQRSLRIFDHSFAATYALEAVAMIIGLLGVSNGFGAQTLLRRQEFALLRCLGLRRRDIRYLLLGEAVLLSLLGVLAGLAVGLEVAFLLIERVNPQSFHWHMGIHIPWSEIFLLALALVLASTFTILWSARKILGRDTEPLHDDG